jgi:probable rRNA maturation factor
MASPSKSKVCFFFEDRSFSLQNRNGLKKFIEGIFRREGKNLESLNYIFCGDKRLLEINQQFLKHDYYTDIITFELSPKGSPSVGEVYISIERVKDNAQNLEQTFKSELHRVIFHGALHLCGYRDKNHKEIQTMRAKEGQYLKSYGVIVS